MSRTKYLSGALKICCSLNGDGDPSYIDAESFLFIGVPMSIFNVPDMTCRHCVKSITEAIKAVAPSAEVACDLSTKLVTVTGQHDADKIQQVVKDAGYSPQPA